VNSADSDPAEHMKYIIFSGWWCPEEGADTRDQLLGDDFIRSADFHRLWYNAIDKFTVPEKIVIVDSGSPTKPPLAEHDPRLEYLSLNHNAGHSTNHVGKYCGFTRAALIGIEYALQCDADYAVYVEQDALIYGDGIIEHCIGKMKRPFMFGHSAGTAQRIQQSLFVIKLSAARGFLDRIHAIKDRDGAVSPEEKFHIAACFGPANALAHLAKNRKKFPYTKVDWGITSRVRNYDFLPIGFGRSRPMDFEQPYFYFQHGSQEELANFVKLAGIEGV
jgi:hypothetical protein